MRENCALAGHSSEWTREAECRGVPPKQPQARYVASCISRGCYPEILPGRHESESESSDGESWTSDSESGSSDSESGSESESDSSSDPGEGPVPIVVVGA